MSQIAKIAILLGQAGLIMSFGLLLIGREGWGLRLITYAFGFLVIGILAYLIDIKNEKN